MAIPEPLGRIVGIFLSIAARMMPNMIGAPSQRRVFKSPPTGYQETALHPWLTFETSMRNQTMVANRNTQTGYQIQHDEHGPIECRKPVDIPKQGHANDGRYRHGEKEDNRWVVRFELWLLHSYPPVTMDFELVDQAEKLPPMISIGRAIFKEIHSECIL